MPTRPTVDALEPRNLFASLTAGVTASTSISAAGTQKNYTVALKAGQSFVVSLGDSGTSSSFIPTLRLIGPDGKTVKVASGDKGTFIGTVAATTGNYIVRVTDKTQTHTGNVTLTAFYTGSKAITDSDDAGTEQSGRRFAASISPGDLDVWRIDAKAGQFLSVVANENSNGSSIGVGVLLVGPDGKSVANKESDTGFAIDQPATKAGTYYAVVYEPGADASGRYGISFGLTPGVQTTEDPDTQSPLVSGTPRNGAMPSGDIDLFQVSLSKGKKVSLTLARTSSNLTTQILLIDPTGKVVATASGSTTASLTYTTLTAGTYSILCRNRDADTGGNYKLTYKLS